MKRIVLSALMLMAFLAPCAHGADGDALTGIWTTPENKARVEVFKCGSKYCGKIIELKEAVYPADDQKGMAGKPKVDRENPNEQLRARPIVGLQILEGFGYAGNNLWDGGTIYDPKNGKTYKCKLTLKQPNELNVRGFIGISLLGRTETWSR